MEHSKIQKSLIDAISEFEIIDCHEHIGPEKRRLEAEIDVFTFFSHYISYDLRQAGMSEADQQAIFNRSMPLKRRWTLFAPYWERLRWTSYAKAALLSVRKLYGFDDFNEKTCEPISQAMQKANTPGIYERVLRDACRIRTALTVCGTTDVGTPLLTPLATMPMVHFGDTWEALSRPEFDPTATIRSLDDLLDAARRYIVRVKSEGAVGLKMVASPYMEPNREAATAVFESLRTGAESCIPEPKWPDFKSRSNPLRDYVIDQAISFATEQDMAIAVHTGYWGDFRTLDPLHMIPILFRHPKARFDIYHLGYPWVRETLMLGKGFPNVWLNLCWTHIISQRCATAALDEAIDLVPMNKLLAFGGDYGIPVEKVYGHLVMAREDVAAVLARRVAEGQMTESQALGLARKWFWDNPKELYRLQV
jgi:predicted TIM-barrel fold metal-dependent hydrolase